MREGVKLLERGKVSRSMDMEADLIMSRSKLEFVDFDELERFFFFFILLAGIEDALGEFFGGDSRVLSDRVA